MAVPGSVVGVGKLITPGGQQGPKGDPGGSAPLADVTQNGLLRQTPGTTTTFVDGTNNYQTLATAVQPTIWSARLRSYNAISNPNFEVTQRNIGNLVTSPGPGVFLEDRWASSRSAITATFTTQSTPTGVLLPGTSFYISSHYLRTNLTAQQASMAAGDFWAYIQYVEGSSFRELIGDASSISLLVRSSVANLNFAVSIRDNPPTKSLTKICNIPSANTWTIISLPNIPVFPSGNFSVLPGGNGCILGICLAAGTTFTASANDTWQNGNFVGAIGQDNFASKPVNSTFDIAFAQHEPGSICTQFIDKPFSQNLDEALRYYQKTQDYDVLPGAVSGNGIVALSQAATNLVIGPSRFHKPMAKVPTMASYNSINGSIASLALGGTTYSVTGFSGVGKAGFSGVLATSLPAVVAGMYGTIHYTADTGW